MKTHLKPEILEKLKGITDKKVVIIGGGINAGKKKNKFNAVPKTYKGQKFHSTKEANYAMHLDACKNATNPAQRVIEYKTQYPFVLKVNGEIVGRLILDFIVAYADGRVEHVDIKGYKQGPAYDLFRLKKKIAEIQYRIEILEK